MKKRLETTPWPSRFLFLLMGFTISVILTSYSMYQEASIKPVTKQEIRTLLESINPAILSKIDKGQKKILVPINTYKLVKLTSLSENPNFGKYLSFKQVNRDDNFNNFKDPNIFVEINDFSWSWCQTYYLYPKDALVK